MSTTRAGFDSDGDTGWVDEFKMAADELDLLASLKGSSRRAVVEPGWGIRVYTEATSIEVIPEETMFEESSFIRVAAASGNGEGLALGPFDRLVVSDRAEIVSVDIGDVALGWVPRERAERRDARLYTGGARKIAVYRSPDSTNLARESARLQAKRGSRLVLVDVAVVITTSENAVTIYSDDAAFFVYAADGINAGDVPLDVVRWRRI